MHGTVALLFTETYGFSCLMSYVRLVKILPDIIFFEHKRSHCFFYERHFIIRP